MPRSIWSGSLSFGLVNIPVKLYSAISPKDIHFHLLHAADGVRIQQKRVCPADGKEVPYENLVKGYEIAPGQYVVVRPEELEALDPKATHTIDIADFVSLPEIDPIHFEHSYYIVPNAGAEKAYMLLLRAMNEANRVAIARMVLRTKEYLVAIRPVGRVLSVVTLLYPDEVVPAETLPNLPRENVDVNPRELAMAQQLIASLSTDFKPDRYHDEYRDRVLALIERKAQGQEVVTQPDQQPPTAKVINLMEALEASLAASKQRAGDDKGGQKQPEKHDKQDKPRRRRKA
jgi:DNA end-binding protein Ku